ncbi:MAG: M15 family metallopeptidase [Verrucomicrobia bacterium]|nr:M15 family metallopeptidase [Verrucomicrobiota bacterium]
MPFCLFMLIVGSALAAPPSENLVEVTPENVPGIVLEMRYATERNITGKKIYADGRAWLRQETIRKLARVAVDLKESGYRLILWDAWRPASAQKALWAAKPDGRFLTPPSKISRHTRGTSVDVSLADLSGKTLEMPSDHDEFSAKADEDFSDVPKEVGRRARILRQAMFRAGFSGVPDEWWHYDLRDWADYEPIEGKGRRDFDL